MDDKIKEHKKKTSVEGSVLKVRDHEVEIELYINNLSYNMSLPLEMFPERVYSGLPITLSQQIIDGVRKNVIVTRIPTPLTKEEKDFLDSINFTESEDYDLDD